MLKNFLDNPPREESQRVEVRSFDSIGMETSSFGDIGLGKTFFIYGPLPNGRSLSTQSPVRSSPDPDLQPCDAGALLRNEPPPVSMFLEGVDVQRGHGVVRTEDGRQAELSTLAVDAWHIKEYGEEEVPRESLGQLHQGDAYIVRWKYSITTLGESPRRLVTRRD